MIPNWNGICDCAQTFSLRYKIAYEGEGWYIREPDYLLAVESEGKIYVSCYTGDPRPEFARVATLPTRREFPASIPDIARLARGY